MTGHTGFKGAWLAFWLSELGAEVTGFALAPETDPALYSLLQLDCLMNSVIGDIRDPVALRDAMIASRPEVVLHLAAQPIVSTGYRDPVGTFATNVMGVVNLLEVCRELGGNLAVLVISSDKCYRNNDENRAFRITDPLGGHDPYSASKAGTEIVVGAYAASYFNSSDGPVLASARAGNVVGGGDWSIDRLLPDGARAFSRGAPLVLRNPLATRPWQHVVEPLYGYMMLIEAMVLDRAFEGPWNFGPSDRNHQSVGTLAKMFAEAWGDAASVEISNSEQDWKEAATLDLDCAETNETLGWQPVLDLKTTIKWTADWYRKAYMNPSPNALRALTKEQIDSYVRL
ncbi:CDP-glucose 4,6-dehydratase [Roseovarius sp. S4756]|uniref:CDP-glucose 4,6-dehydratase n=1 Tax=Roseovarius maritimus TaxID=3342637 RepID=UPI00372AF3E3